ncbi:cytochrome C oxidase subunit IV family protein [Mangrovibacterium diazotrophicum]|uniref:Cytochrome c oxidase subunit 4 n=1 Tax=Mangrovibacterium diazotrophicum TaxID=1261403 RepID=A0A419W7M2_9BACT|nr:cytochrome C oxidase subunit IV family protein [Mangrovibacterium diazotrophicum]RKD91420.1 cytochrome c oxidase subunit 4 [Mangrovibacterium diazotrophicum]
MENEKHHIVPYRTYFYILAALLVFTLLSIEVTSIELGGLTVAAALLFASLKSFLVLTYFMHLKFDKPYIRIMVVFVLMIFLAVIIITFFDYFFR